MATQPNILFRVIIDPLCDTCTAGRLLVEEIARANARLRPDVRVIDLLAEPDEVVASRALDHPTVIVEIDGSERARFSGSLSKRAVLFRLLPILYGDDHAALAELRRQLDSPTEMFPTGRRSDRVRQGDKVALIKSVPLFERLNRRQLSQLARLADEVHRGEHEILVKEGDVGDEFFVVVSGAVRVARKRRGQVTLGAGDFFGEMSLLDDLPRSATVTSTEPSVFLVIHRNDFERWLLSSPAVMRTLLATLSQRLR